MWRTHIAIACCCVVQGAAVCPIVTVSQSCLAACIPTLLLLAALHYRNGRQALLYGPLPSGFNLSPADVHLESRHDRQGNPTGTGVAYVQFSSPDVAESARSSKHKQTMGTRYIECMTWVAGMLALSLSCIWALPQQDNSACLLAFQLAVMHEKTCLQFAALSPETKCGVSDGMFCITLPSYLASSPCSLCMASVQSMLGSHGYSTSPSTPICACVDM